MSGRGLIFGFLIVLPNLPGRGFGKGKGVGLSVFRLSRCSLSAFLWSGGMFNPSNRFSSLSTNARKVGRPSPSVSHLRLSACLLLCCCRYALSFSWFSLTRSLSAGGALRSSSPSWTLLIHSSKCFSSSGVIRESLSTLDGGCSWYVWPSINLRLSASTGSIVVGVPLLFERLNTFPAAFDERWGSARPLHPFLNPLNPFIDDVIFRRHCGILGWRLLMSPRALCCAPASLRRF